MASKNFDFRSPSYVTGYYRIAGTASVTAKNRTATGVTLEVYVEASLAGWIHNYSYINATAGGTSLGSAQMSSPSWKWGTKNDYSGKLKNKRTASFSKTVTVSASTTSLTVDLKFDCYGYNPTFCSINVTFAKATEPKPTLSDVQWTASRFLIRQKGGDGNYATGTAVKGSSNWVTEDMVIPSTGATVLAAAKITNQGTITAGRVTLGEKIVSFNGGKTNENCYVKNGWLYGKFSISSSDTYPLKEATFSYSNKDATSKTVKLQKWIYKNVKPSVSNLRWTSAKYVTSKNPGSVINNNSYCAESIIIPSSGADVTIWAEHASRSDTVAPIRSRTITIGGTALSLTTNGTGFWGTKKITSDTSTIKAYYTDALGETSATKTVNKTCYINSKPTISKIEWTAGSFVTATNRWGSSKSSGYHYDDLFIPSSGSNVTVRAYYSNSRASITGKAFYREGGNSWSLGGTITNISGGFSSTVSINSGWLYPDTRVVLKSPRAYIVDALGEYDYRTLEKWVYLNTPPTLSDTCWTASSFLERIVYDNGTFSINTTKYGISKWVTQDMIIPSTGATVRASAKYTHNVGFASGSVKIGSETVKSSDTSNYWYKDGWVYGNTVFSSDEVYAGKIYKEAVVTVTDVLGESATHRLSQRICVNTPPNITKLRWTADTFVLNGNKNTKITGGVSASDKYYANSITIPSKGSNVSIWAEHTVRTNVQAPIKTRVIKNGGSSGTSWSISSNDNGFWGTKSITSTISNPYALVTDYLDESDVMSQSITCSINVKPKLTDIKWSATNYLIKNNTN